MRTFIAAVGPALLLSDLHSTLVAAAASSSSSAAAAFVVLPSLPESGRRRRLPSRHRRQSSSSSFLLPSSSSRSYSAASSSAASLRPSSFLALYSGLTPRDNERIGDDGPVDDEEGGPIGGEEEESSVAPRLEDARAASSPDAMPPPWTPTSSMSPEKALLPNLDADEPEGGRSVVPPTVGQEEDEWREFRDADRDWDNEYYAEEDDYDWGATEEESSGRRRGGLLPPKRKNPFLQPDEPVGRSVVLPTIESGPAAKRGAEGASLGFGAASSPPRKAGKRKRGGGLLPPKDPIPGLHADEPIGSVIMPVIGPPDVLNDEEEDDIAGGSGAETEREARRRPFFAEEANRELPTEAITGEDEASAASGAVTDRPDSRGFAPPKTPPENPKQERGKLLPPKESIPGLHADEPVESIVMPVIGPPDELKVSDEDYEEMLPDSKDYRDIGPGSAKVDSRGFTPHSNPPEKPKRERGRLLPPKESIPGLHADEPIGSVTMPVIGPPDELKVSDEDYEEMLAHIKDDREIGPGSAKVDSRGFAPPNAPPERPKRERGKLLPPKPRIAGLHADEPIGSVVMPVIGPPDRLVTEEEREEHVGTKNARGEREEAGFRDDTKAKVDTRGFTPSPPAEAPKRERGKLLPPKEPIPGLDHDEPIGGSVVLPVIGPPDTLITKAKGPEEEEEGVFADGADVRGFTADVRTMANARGFFGVPGRPPPKKPRQTDALKRNIENILIDSDAETPQADARHLAPVRSTPNAANKERGKLLPPREKVPGLDVDEPIGGSVVLPVIGPPDRLKDDKDGEEEEAEEEAEGADYYRGEVDDAMAHLFDEENGGYEAGTEAAGGFSSSTAAPPPPAIPVARGDDDGAASGEKLRTVTDAELLFLHERIQELEDQVRKYQEFIADNLVTTWRGRDEAVREAEERTRSKYEKKIAELLEDESEGNSE